MGEYLRFELRFRDVPFRNVSLRVAEVDAGRLLAGGEAIAELLFSPSDSAKSCLMISPFSHFSAFLGPRAHVFAKIANTARAVTTPMNTMPIITRFSTTCVVKAVVQPGILHLLALQDVGYRSCCPHPPLLCPRAALGSPSPGHIHFLSTQDALSRSPDSAATASVPRASPVAQALHYVER